MSRGLTNVCTQVITLIAKFMAFVFYCQCLSEVGLWSSRLTVSDSFTQRRGGTTPVWFTSSGLPQYSHGKAVLFVGQFCIWTTSDFVRRDKHFICRAILNYFDFVRRDKHMLRKGLCDMGLEGGGGGGGIITKTSSKQLIDVSFQWEEYCMTFTIIAVLNCNFAEAGNQILQNKKVVNTVSKVLLLRPSVFVHIFNVLRSSYEDLFAV